LRKPEPAIGKLAILSAAEHTFAGLHICKKAYAPIEVWRSAEVLSGTAPR
jgi:hypothetical protein